MEQSIPITISIKDGKSTEWHFRFEYLQNRFEMLEMRLDTADGFQSIRRSEIQRTRPCQRKLNHAFIEVRYWI